MLDTFDLVLFGGTGDLSTRKLIPALYRQETVLSLDDSSQIIGVGTKDLTNDEYIKVIQNSLVKFFPGFNNQADSWKRFSQRIKYNKLDINLDEDWKKFVKTKTDRVTVFYLAIPPNLYKLISIKLKEHQLITKNSRIVVEKPIGTDQKNCYRYQ